MQTDSTDLAYLAGVIDADGYVTATRSRHGGRVYFGAQVSHHQPTRDRAHHRTQYHWQRGGSRAVPVITAVLPYLRVKYERARLVLELQEHVDWIRETRRDDDPFPWMPAGYDPNQHLCEMVEEIRSFNARAGRTWDQYPQDGDTCLTSCLTRRLAHARRGARNQPPTTGKTCGSTALSATTRGDADSPWSANLAASTSTRSVWTR